MSLYFFAIFV